MEDKVLFKRLLGSKGGATGVTIPPELLNYLGAKEGDFMVMIADNGKHGRFISMWKEGVD